MVFKTNYELGLLAAGLDPQMKILSLDGADEYFTCRSTHRQGLEDQSDADLDLAVSKSRLSPTLNTTATDDPHTGQRRHSRSKKRSGTGAKKWPFCKVQ